MCDLDSAVVQRGLALSLSVSLSLILNCGAYHSQHGLLDPGLRTSLAIGISGLQDWLTRLGWARALTGSRTAMDLMDSMDCDGPMGRAMGAKTEAGMTDDRWADGRTDRCAWEFV